MELRQLTTFRMVATTLNFTQAGAALGYVQSSVTAQIKALEGELGVPLFNRLGKRVTLTDAGQRLLDYAHKILNLADEARQVSAGLETFGGKLTISAGETICTYRLPAVLQRFRERCPHVRLAFHPYPVAELRRRVAEDKLDIGFILSTDMPAGELQVQPLVEENVILLCGPDHPLTRLARVKTTDLSGEALLLTELGCDYRHLFERILRGKGIYPATALEFDSIEAIKKCVMNAMGITVLPEVSVAEELARDQLVALPWEDGPLRVHTQMVWHKNKYISPALGRFIETVRQAFDIQIP